MTYKTFDEYRDAVLPNAGAAVHEIARHAWVNGKISVVSAVNRQLNELLDQVMGEQQ